MAIGANITRVLTAAAVCAVAWWVLPGIQARAETAPLVQLPIKTGATAILSISDRDQAVKVMTAVRKKKWHRAQRLIKKIDAPLAHKLLDWLYFVERGNDASFAEISSFIQTNPDWPRQGALLHRAEAAIDDAVGTDARLTWFKQHPPVSGSGKIRHAEALMASGSKAQAIQLLRNAWVNENFPYRLEQKTYKRYRKLFSRELHQARLDRLLWEGRRQPARRMLERVGKDWKRLGDARLSLRRRSAEVDRKVAKVPDLFKSHPGLVYERARWRRRKNLDETARDLLLANGTLGDGELHPAYAARVWTERAIQTRKALASGEITNAYRLASEHGLSVGAKLAQAEWLAGWIALRHLAEPDAAYQHFLRLHDTVRYPISISRAAYWAARAAADMKDVELAADWYEKAALHRATYYGQLAAQELAASVSVDLASQPVATGTVAKSLRSHELHQIALMLKELDEGKRLRPFILRLFELDPTAPRAALVADLARSLGRTDLAVTVTKRGARQGLIFPNRGYPVIDLPAAGDTTSEPEAALVLALSRQESAFNPKAVSRAGARGLMQLMPGTARATARMIRVKYSRKRLTDPKYNTALGRAHLRTLLEAFDGSYVLSLAAYNAGKHRVKRWLKDYGDPRHPDADPIDWVESIPFEETRNYVQRVLEGVQIYRHRLAGQPVQLRLQEDLRRAARTEPDFAKPRPRPTVPSTVSASAATP
jgi:soluble lytic murein transglycosylase